MRKATSRGYCICCGSQRDEKGSMIHDEECIWYGAADADYIDENGQRTIIWCPYIPEAAKRWT